MYIQLRSIKLTHGKMYVSFERCGLLKLFKESIVNRLSLAILTSLIVVIKLMFTREKPMICSLFSLKRRHFYV